MLILWTCLKTPSLIPLPSYRTGSKRLCIVMKELLQNVASTCPFHFHLLTVFLYHLPLYLMRQSHQTSHSTPNTPFFLVFMHSTCWSNSLDFPSPCGKFQLILQIPNFPWNLFDMVMENHFLSYVGPFSQPWVTALCKLYCKHIISVWRQLNYCTDLWNHYTKQNTAFCVQAGFSWTNSFGTCSHS